VNNDDLWRGFMAGFLTAAILIMGIVVLVQQL
jgi:hypothetical protein